MSNSMQSRNPSRKMSTGQLLACRSPFGVSTSAETACSTCVLRVSSEFTPILPRREQLRIRRMGSRFQSHQPELTVFLIESGARYDAHPSGAGSRRASLGRSWHCRLGFALGVLNSGAGLFIFVADDPRGVDRPVRRRGMDGCLQLRFRTRPSPGILSALALRRQFINECLYTIRIGPPQSSKSRPASFSASLDIDGRPSRCVTCSAHVEDIVSTTSLIGVIRAT